MKIIVLLAAIAVAAAVPHHKALKRPNYDNIDYYSCNSKADGNYIHPTDCTRFIKCSNGRASDMACADCDQHNSQCDGSKYLVWNQPTETCEWPETTDCVVDDVSTEDPVTDGPTEKPTEDPTEGPTEEPTTEVAPVGPCNGMKAGQSCEADDCDQCAYCLDKTSYYFWCNRTIPSNPHAPIVGFVVHEQCDDETWWNPIEKPNGVGLGGQCDFWENLPESVKEQYEADKNCIEPRIICEYGQDEVDECSAKYWYYDPAIHANFAERQVLSCSSGLLWHQATETCRKTVSGC